MKKYIRPLLTALAAVLIALLLSGCAQRANQIGDPKQAATAFSLVDHYTMFDVIVDTSTGVMYARSQHGALTVLVNADGSPRLFPGFDAKEDRYA